MAIKNGVEEKIFASKASLFSLFLAITTSLVALLLGMALGKAEPIVGEAIIGLSLFCILVLLRQDELLSVSVIAIHLYIDWYLGGKVIAIAVASILVLVFYLDKSPTRPWTTPRFLPLWIVFIVLGVFPAMRGFTLADGFTYYINTMVGAFVVFLLGAIVARNVVVVKKLFSILSLLGTALAVETLFQAETGILLLGTSRFDNYLVKVSDFALAASDAHRTGAFFVDPNWNGTFLAMMLFIPLGIFFHSQLFREKVFCLTAALLIVFALIFTYSTGAWIGAIAGLAIFLLLVGRNSHRIQIATFVASVSLAIVLCFPKQLALQLQHASGSTEVLLRVGAWQTAIKVITAFPFTGVGLGLYAYLEQANAFRVPAQYIPLAHPHESYLELGAMGGIQLAAVFILLLLLALYASVLNWKQTTVQCRPLFAGGIASIIALTINSLSINGWTLPPLTILGWLILGVLSSSFLVKGSKQEKQKE